MNYRTWSNIFFVLIFLGGVCAGFSALTTVSAPWNIVGNCIMTVMQLVWLYAIAQYNKTKSTRNQVIMLNRIGILIAIPMILSPWVDDPVSFDKLIRNADLPHMRMLSLALILTYFTLLLAWSVSVFVQMHKKWLGSHHVLWMYLALEVAIDIVGINLLPERNSMPVQVLRFAVGSLYGALFFFIAYKVCHDKAYQEL